MKLSASAINLDRYLLSIHKDDLGVDHRSAFLALTGRIGLPLAWRGLLADRLADVDVIHLGHEGGRKPMRKLYLEFATQLNAALAHGATGPLPVHLALKWTRGENDAALSHYRLDPARQSLAAMTAVLSGAPALPSRCAASGVLDLAAQRTTDVIMLEVSEETTLRRSWDFNVYAAGLLGRDIDAVVGTLMGDYDIALPASEALRATLADQQIGHISVGSGRDAQDFTTLYFGVEARHGGDHG